MSEKKPVLVLLDAHAIIHRAYHALPQFASGKGEPTGALFGIGNMLLRAIGDVKPDYIVACYDLPQKTFRHHAYDNYKAGRAKADEALVRQIETSRDLFKALSIPIYDAPGFEADDMIGSIVHQMQEKNPDYRVVIVTGDMDTLQLVSDDTIVVYTLRRGIEETMIYNEQAVKDRFGFGPEHIIDYKGLRGDPSDNIPGVKGVGEKTATTLIQTAGTVEKVYELLKDNPDVLKKAGITERIMNLLREHEEDALFSKTLATIRRDAPCEFSLPDHFPSVIRKDELISFFDHYELRALKTRWLNYLEGKSPSRAKDVFEDLEEKKEEEVVASGEKKSLSIEAIRRLGIMLWITDSEKTTPTEEEIFDATKTANEHDAERVLLGRLSKEGLLDIWKQIEEPLIPLVEQMQEKGIGIDVSFLKEYEKKLAAERDALSEKIRAYGKPDLNINSPKQLAQFLFEDLKLPTKGSRGKAGSFSTKSDVLEGLRELHPVVDLILEFREIDKLLSTYVSVFPGLVSSDGRLHTTLYQHGTTTGRFSSTEPNLQNIPIRTERGAHMRNAFVSEKGNVMLSADYSQVELRAAAFLSGDEALLQVFQSGRDVHTETAARMMRIPPEDVTPLMRRQAKVINFGVLYGMGVVALQKNLGVSRAEATGFLNAYKESYPKLMEYLEHVKKQAALNGCTETFFGRKRRIPLLRSPLPYLRAQGERMAINAPIQGTAADMMKLGILFVSEDIQKEGLGNQVFPILQVHDELLFEVKKEALSKAESLIKKAMESVFERSFRHVSPPLPFPVEMKSGPSWGQMK